MTANRNSGSASSWNQETKARLNEKITANVNDLGSLARQIIRGSKSNEVTIIFSDVSLKSSIRIGL